MISATMGKLLDPWDTILEKTGVKRKPHVDKLRLHDLRHTCATNLARAGQDIKLIGQYLGHADVKTTAQYIHSPDEDLKAAAETLGRSPISTPIRPWVLTVMP
jgi:integrase